MFLPYGTDAQSVRAPIGTYSLIATNVVLFFLQDVVIPDSVYVLKHGGGLNPIQWIGSAFGHGDLCHLIGNMIFLFAFGIAVESCMRTWRFIAIYFAAIILKGMFLDIATAVFDFHSSGSLGASGVIYSLMMIGILAVPNRNIKCLLTWLYVRWMVFEVPLLIFSMFYIFWDIGAALFTNFEMSTPFLHATGAIVGLAVGIVVYPWGWFESDGEDLVSLVREAWHGPKVDRRTDREILSDKVKAEAKNGLPNKIAQLDKYLKQGGLQIALDTIVDIRGALPDFHPTEKQVVRLINLATRREEFDCAMFWIDEYLRRFDKISNLVRLKRARLLVVAFESPKQAFREMRNIDRRSLNMAQQRIYRQLVAKSTRLKERMLDEGELEIRRPEFDPQISRRTPSQGNVSATDIPPEFSLFRS